MNGFAALFDGVFTQSIPVGMIARASAALAIAWLAHFALVRSNPRWRVLVWRMAAVALVIAPAMMFWGPALSVGLLPAAQSSENSSLSSATQEISVPASDTRREPALSDVPSVPITSMQSDAGVASAAPAVQKKTDWAFVLFVVWGIGVCVGLIGEVYAGLRLASLRRRSFAVDDELILAGNEIAARMNCRRKFEIRGTRDLESPCVFGALHSIILISEVDCKPERREALPAILSHEIAHVAGGDVVWNGILRVLASVLWFHPLIWRVRQAHLTACDQVCDATAANLTNDVRGYGQLLAQLALRIAKGRPAPALEMARPSSVRRRIEALHRRVYSARPARTAVFASIAAGVLLAGLCGAISIVRAAAPGAADAAGLSVSGRVLNEKDEPVPGATVYVHSAGVRVGTSPFCPTCYADCGKRATTDADGRFKINGLDGMLVFQFLATAEGHRPAFIKVDPLTEKSVAAKLRTRPIPDDPKRVVRGVVIGPNGRPTAGALVDPFGCKTAEKRWWGQMNGVESLAVTNEKGEFAIVCDTPVEGLDLKVEARAAVRKNFTLVASGAEVHRLVLETGATVTGRLLDRGAPLAGVSIGIFQADRSVEHWVGPYTISTDKVGRFTLTNLPLSSDMLVYGIMDSLRAKGSLPATEFRSPGDGESIDLGELSLRPAYAIRGRIALADGKPIPSQTRVMLSRANVWDTTFTEAGADGRFTFSGIPPEVVQISIHIPGYRLSPKNRSFETLNGASVKGLVSADVRDLVILYEPGNTIRPDYDRNWQVAAEKFKRLDGRPLAGVAADLTELPAVKDVVAVIQRKPLPKIELPPEKPALTSAKSEGAKKSVSGTVVDAQGQPIKSGQIWLPVRWISYGDVLTATDRSDGNGAFRLNVPEAWLNSYMTMKPAAVWAYSPGLAIGTGNASLQLFGGVDPAKQVKIELPPEDNLSFVVLLPDGKTAAGAKVKPLHFTDSSTNNSHYIPRELAEMVAGVTDAQGRVAIQAMPREALYTIEIELAGYGVQQFRCDLKSTDPPEQKLRLRPAGRIEGRIAVEQVELTRGMFVAVETKESAHLVDIRQATGVAYLNVDEQGRFVIPEIAEGTVEIEAMCDERLPVRPRLPARNSIKLLAGETRRVEFPLEMGVRIHGVVRAKDTQKPIPNVRVSIRYGVGRQGDDAHTNERGEFSATALSGEVYAQVIELPQGYVQLGSPWDERRTVPEGAEQFEWPAIELAPTRDIAGKLIDSEGNSTKDMTIHVIVANRRYGYGKSDENGVFKLSGVPKEVEMENFEVWTREERFVGEIVTRDPLVIRIKK